MKRKFALLIAAMMLAGAAPAVYASEFTAELSDFSSEELDLFTSEEPASTEAPVIFDDSISSEDFALPEETNAPDTFPTEEDDGIVFADAEDIENASDDNPEISGVIDSKNDVYYSITTENGVTTLVIRAQRLNNGASTISSNAEKPWENTSIGKKIHHVKFEKIKNVPAYFFENYADLKSYESDTYLETIEKYAFCSTGLSGNIEFPAHIKSIDSMAFSYTKIERISFLNPDTTLNGSFYACEELNYVVLPSNLKTIGQSTFSACTSLETIKIPKSVTTIQRNAFLYSGLMIVGYAASTLPDTIEAGNDALLDTSHTFFDITNLFYTSYIQGHYTKGIGYLANYSKDTGTYSLELYSYDSQVRHLPKSEKFSNIKHLIKTITLEDLDSMDEGIFADYSALTSFQLGSVTTIPIGAFQNCSSLSSITTISNGIQRISMNAFENCSTLKTVIFPSTISFIHSNAFTGCSSISAFCFRGTYVSTSNLLSHHEKAKLFAYVTNVNENGDVSGVVPGVTPDDFSNMGYQLTLDHTTNRYDLRLYALDGTVTSRNGTSKLPFSLNIQSVRCENVTVLPNSAFEKCTNLTYVDFGDHLEEIGEFAFWHTNIGGTLVIPKTVKKN